VQAIIKALLEHMRAAPPAAGSFADLLQRARDPRTGAPLTSRQIFPEAAALLFAGTALPLASAHRAWGEPRGPIAGQNPPAHASRPVMTENAAGAGIDTSGHTGTFVMCAHAAPDSLHPWEPAKGLLACLCMTWKHTSLQCQLS
jgi:hypothetical protein